MANQAYIAGYATESDLSSKADLSAIPTTTSQLSNDSGYATKEWVEGQDYATETYAVQNLGGVAKIQSMELSDY